MGDGNKVEFLVAVCAIITSVMAVYIAWDQARVMRSQEKATVWPILQVLHHTGFDDGGFQYRLSVENAGVGPALIEDFTIRIPGQPETQAFSEMVKYLASDALFEKYGHPFWQNMALENRVLRQGTEIDPVRAQWAPTDGLARDFEIQLSKLLSSEVPAAEVFVCYCSILEDCWVATSSQTSPKPRAVESCSELKKTADIIMSEMPTRPQPEELVQ